MLPKYKLSKDHTIKFNCSFTHVRTCMCVTIAENPNCTYGEVRLMDGSNKYEGRVEICFGGRFGTVCDDLWDILDAAVVCSELGFSADGTQFKTCDYLVCKVTFLNSELYFVGATPFSSSRFGTGEDMPIFIDDTRCIGNESGLVECSSSGIGFHNCLHVEDAGVRCKRELKKHCHNLYSTSAIASPPSPPTLSPHPLSPPSPPILLALQPSHALLTLYSWWEV